jgi:BirA family biotin operon repressor/biotin-[acetyl-CoA-carboxylase] ligase
MDRIRPELQRFNSRIEVLEETDSTQNQHKNLPSRERHGRVELAERQTAGKGRRGRQWTSPAGNILLSMGWNFAAPSSSLSSLALMVALSVCRALEAAGLRGHGIKWPNDIQVSGAKLCGILVELSSRGTTGCSAVIGIGINVRVNEQSAGTIDQHWTDLESLPGVRISDRNHLTAMILQELLGRLASDADEFGSELADHWPAWDLLCGKQVRVVRDDMVFEGEARGVDEQGALRLLIPAADGVENGEIMTFHSGEVSVRLA